jgi:RHS repeat-associated protein
VWLYDEAGRVLGEYGYPGGAAVQELVWLGGTPIAVAGAMPTAYGIGYIWSDQLSTPRAITNANGQVLWQWDSAPFGETAVNSNPNGLGALIFNHRFPGQYFDAATGLHQNGTRSYDPALGRYVQSDPAGILGGANTYLYAIANPVSAIDPSGLDGFVFGAGYTDFVGYGTEGSAGRYLSGTETGFFSTSGDGIGLNGGVGPLFGWFKGDSPAGITSNYTFPIEGTTLTVTLSYDPQTRDLVGVTLGGGPVSLPAPAVSVSTTTTTTTSDASIAQQDAQNAANQGQFQNTTGGNPFAGSPTCP